MNRDASPADQPSAEQSGRRAARRFLYGTGDQPLEGYTIKRGVGRGGFGEVYFATSDAGKEVALKLIRRNLDIEIRGVRQCLNLKHSNLISLYDLKTDSADDQWVVMEYVAGESLDQIIDRHPQGMPADEALAWIRGIASGVAYLHQNGIVHRDLKPGNLFLEGHGSVTEGGIVKIGDYGLSKFIAASQRSGQTESVGTVHYMAPEISGGRYGREIDTYALGIILYEMLTGHVPFEGESVGEVLMKHLTAEPDLSALDEPYRTIVARALAKDPETRLQSVDELVSLLPGSESSEVVLEIESPSPSPHQANDGVWRPVENPPHTAKHGVEPEPLWQAFSDGVDNARVAWRDWNVSPAAKGAALFAIVATVALNSTWAIPMATALIPLYLVYYVVWAIFFRPHGAQGEAGQQRLHRSSQAPTQAGPVRIKRLSWRELVRHQLAEETPRKRFTKLTGSMFIAGIVATTGAAIAGTLLAKNAPVDAVPLVVWLAIVGTLGSWAHLIGNSLHEARVEDNAPRRGWQLATGIGLGCLAALLLGLLRLELPVTEDFTQDINESLVEEIFDVDLYPQAASNRIEAGVIGVPIVASAIYFALLFFIARWWKLADYTRGSRIGFFSTVGVMLWAWLLTYASWYPQPTGLVVAGIIGLATQAAAGWLPPSERKALARRGVMV